MSLLVRERQSPASCTTDSGYREGFMVQVHGALCTVFIIYCKVFNVELLYDCRTDLILFLGNDVFPGLATTQLFTLLKQNLKLSTYCLVRVSIRMKRIPHTGDKASLDRCG